MKARNNKNNDALIKAVLALKNSSEAKKFLRDLLTAPELKEFGSRWLAAKMLAQKVPYSLIQSKTGLSSTTVARISKWLNKGKGGYKLMINRLSHHHTNSSSKKGLA